MTVITLKTLKESYLKKEVVCLPITHLQKDYLFFEVAFF